MKFKLTLILALLLTLLVSSSVQATSTEVWGQKFVEVTWTSSLTDWTCSRSIIPVRVFVSPSAANDVLVLRENSVTGPRIVKQTFSTTEASCIPFYGSRDEAWKPCIKASDQTFGTFGNVIVTIEFK